MACSGKARSRQLWFGVVAVVGLWLMACTAMPGPTPKPTSAVAPTLLRVNQLTATPTSSPMPLPTPLPRATVPTVEEAVRAFSDALTASDVETLQTFLLDKLTIASGPNVQSGELWTRIDAIGWLQERWSASLQVVDYSYIQHYELLEIKTQGWQFSDGSATTIVFHLHRYNAANQWDIEGKWLVDFVVYW